MTEGKYGMLTIGEFSHQKGRDFYHMCKCDCGNERIMNVRHILGGGSKTCGGTRVRLSQEDKFNIALEYEAWAEVTYATDFLQSDRVVVMSFCVKRVKNGVIDLIIGSFNPAPAPEKETTP